MRAVVGCGHHPKNPTIQALFELRCDPPEVLNLGEEDLAGEIKGPKRGLRNIYVNKIPTLVDLELAPDLQAAWAYRWLRSFAWPLWCPLSVL